VLFRSVELPGDKVRSGGIRIGRNAWGDNC